MNDITLVELIQRVEALETRLLMLHEMHQQTVKLTMASLEIVDVVETIDRRWMWLAVQSINTTSLLFNELNNLRESHGLSKYTQSDIQEKLEKTIESSARMLTMYIDNEGI